MEVFMKKLAAVFLFLFLSLLISCYDGTGSNHVILFIGDGMQLEHEIATSRYLYGKDDGLVFHSFPYVGSCTTWDVSAYNYYAKLNNAAPYDPENFDPVIGYNPELGGERPYPLSYLDTQYDYFITHGSATDSASAATAMSTGYKTDEGNICWLAGDPENGALRIITEDLRGKLGFSYGIVSTVQFSHATPAGFASHNVSRNNYGQIGHEIATITKPDVVIGAGHPAWEPRGFRYIPEEDYNMLKASQEYVFVERAAGADGGKYLLKAAKETRKKGKKLFGLFGGPGGHFENPVPVDMPGKPAFTLNEENPQLSEMVKAALEVLSKNKNGFFVMFEQGDIDWANHANDYQWMIGAVYDLNEGVKAAIEFVNKPGDNIDWSNTTIIVTSDHSNSYMRLNDDKRLGKGDLPAQVALGSGYAYPDGDVTYSSMNHTNEPVMIYALGRGAHRLKKYEGKINEGTKLVDNTDIYRFVKEITGLDIAE
jgi:alkaline phosphatase